MTHLARNAVIKIGSSSPASNTVVDWKDGDFSMSKTKDDIGTHDSGGYDESATVSKKITGKFDVLFDDADASHAAIEAAGEDDAAHFLEISQFGTASGKDYLRFAAHVEVSYTQAMNGHIRASVSFESTGTITRGTHP